MKRLCNIFLVFISVFLVFACKKNAVQVIDTPSEGAKFKFFNFSLGNTDVNLFANTTKLTATNSTTSALITSVTYAASYPVSQGMYALVPSGMQNMMVKSRPNDIKYPDIIFSSFNYDFSPDVFYSIFAIGNFDVNAQKVDYMVITDDFKAIDTAKAQLRFVNLLFNVPSATVTVKNTTTNEVEIVFANALPYKGIVDFTNLSPGTYTVTLSAAGTTNKVIRTDIVLLKGRIYTIASYGNILINSTTDANRGRIDYTQNL